MAEIVNSGMEIGQATGELQNVHSTYQLNGKNYLKWSLD